jgi:hypothetical protein
MEPWRNGSVCQPPLKEHAHFTFKCLAKADGMEPQMCDGFGLQEWSNQASRFRMSQLEEQALAGELPRLCFADLGLA